MRIINRLNDLSQLLPKAFENNFSIDLFEFPDFGTSGHLPGTFRAVKLSCKKPSITTMQPPVRKTALTIIYAVTLSIAITLSSFQSRAFTAPDFNLITESATLYQAIDPNEHELPPYDLFNRALTGYQLLEKAKKLSTKGVLTLIDFRRSANEKRLWVIDLVHKKILFHTLTAHGRNTGDVFARNFSNTPNSNQSSLGFYVTGKTYIGKHGISLKLHGVENGINDKAEARAIVMHGATYVSESYIKQYGRLGRSFGCPAIPMALHKKIITEIAEGTCLFIFYPDPTYVSRTKFKDGLSMSL
ncbi:murein L,D-transpeptidase catalytic domain family protein [Chryseolinea sp. H1M3-3]|uniref:murein L,D-transpeptidase catalytic domain family protein n=1 Tax=Chryseolinea sp. H1M3-3 TaxID=3034144 RepID=UPI0023EDD67A|nr:murein L,D-transpeptidase catalytic domain family protein [Chryseolinea sp. H1M3-3]